MTNLGTIGTIRITKALKESIDYHHRIFGGKEWSGMLFYRHTGGSFSALKDLKFVADSFYLMDIGSDTATEHTYEGDAVITAYEVVPNAIEALMGNIHTHHSMGAFHSGTDMSDIEKNAKNYGFYISLVVDTKDTYKCKVAIPAQPTTLVMVDAEGKERKLKSSMEPVVLVGDLDVLIPTKEIKIPDWIKERVDELQEAEKAAKDKAITTAFGSTAGYGSSGGYYRNNGYGGYDGYTPWGYSSSAGVAKVDTKTSVLPAAKNMESFIVSILTGGDFGIDTIEEALQVLAELKGQELKELLEDLEVNLEIHHYNTYGNSPTFDYHLKEAIKTMEDYAPFAQLKEVLNKLKEIQSANVSI